MPSVKSSMSTGFLIREAVWNAGAPYHCIVAGNETLGQRTMLLNARKLFREGRRDLILLAIEDITARTEAEAHRDLLIAEMSYRSLSGCHSVLAFCSFRLR